MKNDKTQKVSKIKKIRKVTKSRKVKNVNHEKVTKCKSENDQKSVKNAHPPKNPKMSDKWPKSTLCEIRAAWSGVFWVPGGTTGPGFKAEIDPPILNGKKWHVFWFSCFVKVTFCTFWHFHDLSKLINFGEVVFFAMLLLHYNKALLRVGEITQGRPGVCVVVSPLIVFFSWTLFFNSCRGDYTG